MKAYYWDNQNDPSRRRLITSMEILFYFAQHYVTDAFTEKAAYWEALRQHVWLGDDKVEEYYTVMYDCIADIGHNEYEKYLEERGEPWLYDQMIKSDLFKDDMRKYEIRGYGINKEAGYLHMIDLMEAEIGVKTRRRARDAARQRPAEMGSRVL